MSQPKYTQYLFDLRQETFIENYDYLPEELERAAHRTNLKIRREYLFQRQLIHKALFAEYETRGLPSKVGAESGVGLKILYTPYGKPYLQDRAFHFSISHCQSALVVVCSDEVIGVDVEKIQLRDTLKLATRFFHPLEVKYLECLDQSNQPECLKQSENLKTSIQEFYRIWTFKEAWIKCRGSVLMKFLGKNTLVYLNSPTEPMQVHRDEFGHLTYSNFQYQTTDGKFQVSVVMDSTPIFEKFPTLQKVRPKVSLMQGFTPVRLLVNERARMLAFEEKSQELRESLSRSESQKPIVSFTPKSLWMKDDAFTHQKFGGNKIRKFEFLMGHALGEVRNGVRPNFDSLVSIGFEGSNHCVATSLVASEFDSKCSVFLKGQLSAPYVEENLAWHQRLGTKIWRDQDVETEKPFPSLEDLYPLVEDENKVFWVPPGGTHPVSHWGYVNAVFELCSQIESGLCSVPDRIYLACGTMGSTVGLIAGLRLAGLKTKVIAVQVVPEFLVNQKSLMKQLDKFNTELSLVGEVPLNWRGDEFEIHTGVIGEGYAVPTTESRALVSELKESENLNLEWTYTGKVWAAIWQDFQAGLLTDLDILYWNTYH